MGQKTALYTQHLALKAKMVTFAGFDMPLHYGSQMEEHHNVRKYAGVFDVSHMQVIEVKGNGAKDFLRYLLANDVAKISPGKALYSCMLNPHGGIIDDLLVYCISDDHYRLVTNAGTREKDLHWIQQQASAFNVTVGVNTAVGILALQGPQALAIAKSVFDDEFAAKVATLAPFHFVMHKGQFVARTGYTGEDGVEIILPVSAMVSLWKRIINAGARPAGLGARDTLRLEAGLNLYGQDMDEQTSPFVTNLGWTVALSPEDRAFIGKQALIDEKKQGVQKTVVGLVLDKGGVLRHAQIVYIDQQQVGHITSGTFSPTLHCAIAMARIDSAYFSASANYQVEIRGKYLPVRVVRLPFVRKGRVLIEKISGAV